MPEKENSMSLLIVLVGSEDFYDTFVAALDSTYALHHITQEGTYMQTLMEEQPVLILVEGTHEDWGRWTSTPKSSPATRRIPIVLLSDDEAQRQQSAKQGADAALPWTRIDPVAVVETYARLPDPAIQQQLDSACDQPLPELAQQGIARFNEGEYYKQHDLLEELWMKTPGPERDLYQAILQVGVAYYQIERGNARGAQKMLQRAMQWLRKLPDVCQGVDVADLRRNAQNVQEMLAQPDFSISTFDVHSLKPVLYKAE
jgi:hypothetical protein